MSQKHISNHVVLYVKAGMDGECYGACPFCQRFYMVLDLKAKGGSLTYNINTVNMARPLPEFKQYANRLPVFKHGDEVVIDSDEIVQYIDENFLKPDLRYDNLQAHSQCLDIFSKFNFFIKNVSSTAEGLLNEIKSINDYLARTETKYLAGNSITHLDCLVMPKLQHIRIAAEAFKDFLIPRKYTHFWRYMETAYNNDTFRKTCPSDQEIVFHWSSKRETTPLPEKKRRFYTIDTEPKFTLTVPH
ncbi:hypothetical protein SNE40_015574 [Patella caerulea]|uniref:GST C-terminal domain-containing protein n=1 Tax=Patella caerulea TaxID=87958 RepID=A0AAN8JHM1_PATCE